LPKSPGPEIPGIPPLRTAKSQSNQRSSAHILISPTEKSGDLHCFFGTALNVAKSQTEKPAVRTRVISSNNIALPLLQIEGHRILARVAAHYNCARQFLNEMRQCSKFAVRVEGQTQLMHDWRKMP
jgi:hypothetical protein